MSKNLLLVAELITTAADEGATMVFLPENFAALASPDVFQVALQESSAAVVEPVVFESVAAIIFRLQLMN